MNAVPGPGKVITVGCEEPSGAALFAHLVLIVDQSGSMQGKEKDVIGGVNKFFADQRQDPRKQLVTIMKFDHEFDLRTSDLATVNDWDVFDYVPRGNTALLDAIGRTLTAIGPSVSTNKPESVIVVIVTDGGENASTEFTRPGIKSLIEHCTKNGWHFMYLGANVDAFAEARSMGIAANMTTGYSHTATGTASAYANMSGTTAMLKATNTSAGINLSVQQDKLEKDAEKQSPTP